MIQGNGEAAEDSIARAETALDADKGAATTQSKESNTVEVAEEKSPGEDIVTTPATKAQRQRYEEIPEEVLLEDLEDGQVPLKDIFAWDPLAEAAEVEQQS